MDYTVTEIEAEFTSARRTAVSNSTEQNKQKVINYSIFNLPSNFLNSSRFIESLSTPELTTATTTEVIAETTKEKNYNFSERLTCNCCNSSFDSLHDQRSHFKSDFHRFNIKLSIAGKNIIKEEDFNELSPDSLVEDYEISSISGSEDEYDSDHDCKSDTIKGFFRSRKQKIYLRVPNGETVSFWKCLILGDLEKTRFENDSMKDDDTFSVSMSEVTDKLLSVIHETRNNIHLRVMLLVSGGHFAGCVFDGNSVVAHKAFHRYVIRAKAGKKQSSKDGSGKTAHSAGASIRRHNELALKKDIRELLAAWKLYFDASVCIFIHAPSHNRKLIFDGENPYFSCHNRSIIRHIPLTVRRPTLSEAQRLYKILTQISLEPNEDIIPIIKEDSTRTLGKENQRNNVENGNIFENSLDKNMETTRISLPLHEAVKAGNAEKVLDLLEQGFDPCDKDERGRTPYKVAAEKEVRNTFRRFMALNPNKWDWQAAKVPSSLTNEMEESQNAKKANKDAKRKERTKELKRQRKAREKKAKEAHRISSRVAGGLVLVVGSLMVVAFRQIVKGRNRNNGR